MGAAAGPHRSGSQPASLTASPGLASTRPSPARRRIPAPWGRSQPTQRGARQQHQQPAGALPPARGRLAWHIRRLGQPQACTVQTAQPTPGRPAARGGAGCSGIPDCQMGVHASPRIQWQCAGQLADARLLSRLLRLGQGASASGVAPRRSGGTGAHGASGAWAELIHSGAAQALLRRRVQHGRTPPPSI